MGQSTGAGLICALEVLKVPSARRIRKCTLPNDASNVACRGVSERHLSQAMAMLTQYAPVMRLTEICKRILRTRARRATNCKCEQSARYSVHRCRQALIRHRAINQSALSLSGLSGLPYLSPSQPSSPSRWIINPSVSYSCPVEIEPTSLSSSFPSLHL